MEVVIDRFEGKHAVCEKIDKKMILIEKDKLPSGVKEGTVLNIEAGKISINYVKTKAHEDVIKKIIDDLWD